MALPKRLEQGQTGAWARISTAVCQWDGCPQQGVERAVYGDPLVDAQRHHRAVHGIPSWGCPECRSTTGEHRDGCERERHVAST